MRIAKLIALFTTVGRRFRKQVVGRSRNYLRIPLLFFSALNKVKELHQQNTPEKTYKRFDVTVILLTISILYVVS